MRHRIRQQLSFVEPAVSHPLAVELQTMGALLDERFEIAELVHADLVVGLADPDAGRKGMMTADQVIRAAVIKQMNEFSYEALSFHLEDSRTYRVFCGFGLADELPSSSTLQRDIKKIRPETLEQVNRILLNTAVKKGIEKGRKVRVDCTVVEANIHHPTDSSLLEDCVRVLARLTERAVVTFTFPIVFADHNRRARKRALEILNAKNAASRLKSYKDLLEITARTVNYSKAAVKSLRIVVASEASSLKGSAENAIEELGRFIDLSERVISQTKRRVIQGESVPVGEKVVSIFEPHTDVIIKDRRETYFGHKVTLTGGASGLITDLVVENGNPADTTLAVGMIARQQDIYGRVPLAAAFDGGFASKDNLKEVKALGVRDACFHKKRGLDIEDMAKSTWVYQQLRKFRAGIEATISYLKRCFGLGRCTWRGFESFKAYAWTSVITANLLLMARHLLS